MLLLALFLTSIFSNVHASPHRELADQTDNLGDAPPSDADQAAAAANGPQAMDVDPNDTTVDHEAAGNDPLTALPFFSRPVSRDFDEDLLNEPTPKIRLHAIEPAQGPITGK
jgi:hypothetical protein